MRFLAVALVLAMPAVARAHPIEFGALQVRERDDRLLDLTFRFSGSEAEPEGVLAVIDGCRETGPVLESREGVGVLRRALVDCGAGGVDGRTLTMVGLAGREEQILVRVERLGAPVSTTLLDGRHTTLVLTGPEDGAEVAMRYVALGARHIAEGVDHLLFVLGLVLLARRPGAIAATVTAFTLGHSATLAVTALGMWTVRPAPVEVLIAASIVLLARELLRGDQPLTLAQRRPWLIAAAFGLLHGMGFAGALAEVGLPDGARTAALLGFNLGVELGQLVFVAALLALGGLLRASTSEAWRTRLLPAVPWAIGVIAAYWAVERSAAIFS